MENRLYTEDELYFIHFILKPGELKQWIEDNKEPKELSQFDKDRLQRWKNMK